MREKIFLDSNILVYLSNEDSPFHAETEIKFKELTLNYDLCISVQVLREYAVVMSREKIYKNILASEQIALDMEKFYKVFKIFEERKKVNKNLIKLLKYYEIKGKHIHDANIVATMMTYGIKKIFTFNEADFKSFKEVEILK